MTPTHSTEEADVILTGFLCFLNRCYKSCPCSLEHAIYQEIKIIHCFINTFYAVILISNKGVFCLIVFASDLTGALFENNCINPKVILSIKCKETTQSASTYNEVSKTSWFWQLYLKFENNILTPPSIIAFSFLSRKTLDVMEFSEFSKTSFKLVSFFKQTSGTFKCYRYDHLQIALTTLPHFYQQNSFPLCETTFTLWNPPFEPLNVVSKQKYRLSERLKKFVSCTLLQPIECTSQISNYWGPKAQLLCSENHCCIVGATSPNGCSQPMTEHGKNTS